MKKYILYIVSLMLLVSCEKYSEVDLDLPFKNKLVAVSFIEEGSNMFQLALTRTTPVQNTAYLYEPNYITDAEVTLHTPGQSYALTYDTATKVYETTMPAEFFEEGKNYRVSVAQGGETIHGNTHIPGLVTPFASVVLDSVFQYDTYTYFAKISCGITNPGRHNIKLGALMVYSDSSVVPMLQANLVTKPISRLRSGEQTTQTFQSAFSSEFISPVRIDVIIMVCDDVYATYINSLNGVDMSSSGVPFGEPYIMYGNMSNKIGVMGAYRYLPSYSVPLK